MPWPVWWPTPERLGKPIVLEKLDFRQKKASWRGSPGGTAGCSPVLQLRQSQGLLPVPGYRQGVEVYQVNPAFSSVMGRVKFMERYGLSVHQAAALVLARRFLGCSEGIPCQRICPVGGGVRVAFTVPARKRVKHVWTLWGCVLGQLRPVLAAQRGLGRRRRQPNPVRAPA